MTQPAAVTINTQEVRLATTMTGGVSLAIWMGGVAREIDLVMQATRARRALQPGTTSGPRGDLTSAELSERDLYGRLLKLLDIVVEVDVLSGTSAGGINAALLAYSRVRNGDLGALRSLWLDLGALLDLLRNPTDSDVPSLLYGDRRMLKDLNERLPGLAPDAPPKDPPSTTLYITTTLLTGETSRFPDSLGTLVQDQDQHGLFTFTEAHLATDEIEGALALAARSTASFPGAFEPSFVPFSDATPAAGEIPPRPAMRDYANITRNHWVVDGGLLDNQPLDVLLERVFDRRARRPVRRVLMFVVPSAGPSPDLAQAAPADNLTKPYGLLDGLLKDLGAATSQSISADLRAIVAHNDRIAAQTDMRAQLADLGVRLRPQSRLLTARLLDDYRTRESERQTRKLVRAMLRLLSTWSPQSSPNEVGIPAEWAPLLEPNGAAERVCRIAVCTELTRLWPRALDSNLMLADDAVPATSTVYAAYGRSLFDDAKSLALSVLRLAYQAAGEEADRVALLERVELLHKDAGKPDRPRPDVLAREVCEAAVDRSGGGHSSLREAAVSLAREWVGSTGASAPEWDRLGEHLRDEATRIVQIASAGAASTSSDPACVVIEAARSAAPLLSVYVGYLGLGDPAPDAGAIAMRLFDLAASEQALLPVESGPFQPVELVQVSADTRGLLTPRHSTAASKLTGLQLHHFGAFYKKSWRANDWMWGRLDAAGWLVHALLDPRRLRVVSAAEPAKVDWLLGELADFGAPTLTAESVPTLAEVRGELAFLDDPTADPPQSLPTTSLWLATAWQRHVAINELPVLAGIITGEAGDQPDRSPTESRAWARKVLEQGADLPALLKTCPVPRETFETDRGSPLMVRTLAKAAAAGTAAASSTKQLPGPVRPSITTAHTVTLAGYRIASAAKALPRNLIIVGAVLLALGIAAATQSATLFGITGLIAAGVGGYLLTFGAWQLSRRLIAALVAVTITGAVASLAIPAERRGLFGASDKDPGYVGRHVHWLATAWWHPLLVVGIVVLAITVVAAVFSQMGRPKQP
jgi:patatin-related protein